MSNPDQDRFNRPKARIAATQAKAPVNYQQRKEIIEIVAKATEEIRSLKGTHEYAQ